MLDPNIGGFDMIEFRMPRTEFSDLNTTTTTTALETMPHAGDPQPPPLPRDPPTATDWENFRRIITELYLDKRRTLNEVIEILRRQHHFNATQRMYNTRIYKWGIYKNSKSWEKQQALLMQGSSASSSQSVTLANGHVVLGHKIDRHRKAVARKGALIISGPRSEDASHPTDPVIPSPSGLAFEALHQGPRQTHHPHPHPPLSEVRTPDSLEPLLKDMDTYYRSYFNHTCRLGLCPHRGISNKITGPARGNHPARLQNQYTTALAMMKEAQKKPAFRLLDRICHAALPMFKAPDPELVAILLVMSQADTQTVPEVSTLLWGSFLESSDIYLMGNHPLTKLCRYLRRFSSQQRAIEQLCQQNHDSYPHCQHSRMIRAKLTAVCPPQNDSTKAEELTSKLHDIVDECEARYGYNDVLVCETLYLIAFLEEQREQMDAAEDIYRDIIGRCNAGGPKRLESRVRSRVLAALGVNLTHTGARDEGEALLRQALGESRREHGDEDHDTLYQLKKLVENLRLRDKHGEIEKLKAESPGALDDW